MTKETTTMATAKSVPKPRTLSFITFSDVNHMRDEAAISRIRRHAMRDIGLQRRKPKKKRRLEVVLQVPPELNHPEFTIGGGGMHTFFHLPVELDEIGKGLLANIWRDEGDAKQAAHRKDWFTVGLADAGTFHQVLANSEIHLESLRNPHRRPRETPLSIYHHQLAIRSIRKQLAEGTVTEGSIGTVTGMLVYAEISGVFENWLPQRKGLVDVINAREGGLEGFEENEHLRATVSWVEVRGAYMQDLPPLLPLPKAWLTCERRYMEDDEPHVSTFELPSHLAGVGQSISALCRQVSINLKKLRNEETFESELLAWTNVQSHRLLSIRKPQIQISEACRLALLMFLAPIYRTYGASPIETDVHVEKLHELVSQRVLSWTGFEDVHLWMLYIAAFEATAGSIKEWFVREIIMAATDMSVFDVEGILSRVRNVLWIAEIFDEKAEVLGVELDKCW